MWDVLTSIEAVTISERHSPDGTAACRALIRRAKAKWAARAGGQGRDDVSAIVVFLPLTPPLPTVGSADAAGAAAGPNTDSKKAK